MKNLYSQTNFRRLPVSRRKSKLASPFFNGLIVEKICDAVLLALAILLATTCFAQTGIKTFTTNTSAATTGTTYTGPGGGISAQSEYIPTSNNTFSYRFGTNSNYTTGKRAVNGYMAGNASYSVIANVVTGVIMRRITSGNGNGNNNRDILFFAGNRNPDINTSGQTNSALTINLEAEYVADMGVAFGQNNLFIGTDNIFSNTGNGNGNNNEIERVDVMIGAGYTIPDVSKYGFPILERGVYGQHDAFKIAVILAVDNLGNPTAYSKVVSVSSANYNNTNSNNPVPDGSYNYFLFRRNGNSPLQVNQHITNQGIGGVAFTFADFGLTNGTKIYGYSIMANDFNSTNGADVINYTNTSLFPTNTNETIGGLDLLAVLGIAMQMPTLPVDMASFTASAKDNKTTLEWTTATEMHNRGYRVERSTNAKEWNNIGFVNTKSPDGNSTESLRYTFSDNSAQAGTNYYRIIQVDVDGTEKYSEVRTASLKQKETTSVTAYPNPVAGVLHVDGISAGTNCKLVDASGTVINQFISTSSAQTVSTEKLIPGIYFLQVTKDNAVVKTIQLVKM